MSAIKEDVQTVQQIVGALQYDKVRIVQIRFPQNDTPYHYKTTDATIFAEDYVVLDTPYSGITVAQVDQVGTPKEFGISNQFLGKCKWVVQKVHFTEYLQNKVNEEQVQKDLLKSIEAKRAQDVLEYARQTFGGGVNATLDCYASSLSNVPVLEVSTKKTVTKRSTKAKE